MKVTMRTTQVLAEAAALVERERYTDEPFVRTLERVVYKHLVTERMQQREMALVMHVSPRVVHFKLGKYGLLGEQKKWGDEDDD